MEPYDHDREAAKRYVPRAPRNRWAQTAEQQEDWRLIQEWLALPARRVRGRDAEGGFDTVRIIRKCPPEWQETPEGRWKMARLCEALGREPFDWTTPEGEGEPVDPPLGGVLRER